MGLAGTDALQDDARDLESHRVDAGPALDTGSQDVRPWRFMLLCRLCHDPLSAGCAAQFFGFISVHFTSVISPGLGFGVELLTCFCWLVVVIGSRAVCPSCIPG